MKLYGCCLKEGEKGYYSQNGIKIVSIYQNDGTKYEYFTEKHAKIDALCALISAKFLGQPENTAIYFGVDYDASASNLPRIQNYFQIIKNKINNRYKLGVYGNGLVCNKIKQELGLAEYSWLSRSSSHIEYETYDTPEKYNIKQSENIYYNNVLFDDDVSVGNNYGAWEA